MQYAKLGWTDIDVSQICLGTMTWGEQNTEAEAHEQLDYALEREINFIDTAELYPVPPKGETQGLTEQYIGTWLAKRSDREKIILASKFCASAEWLPYLREGKNKADKANIHAALDASLERLQTDYLDLYQVHWPERDTNFFGKLGYYHAPEKDGVAIAETLEVLAELVDTGKIKYIGVSNETPWGVAEYLRVAEKEGFPRIVTVQNPYNLLNRSFEVGLAEFAHREQTGLLAYSPLAFGALTAKYLNGQKPEGARLSLFTHFSRYNSEIAQKAIAAYAEIAKKYDLTPATMALAYINSRSFLTANIIGATNMEQLKENIDSIEVTLDKECIREIEEFHSSLSNPCP